MQRRSRTYVTGVALVVVLSGGLTACTGSSDDAGDTKPGDPSASASSAPPGKYRTLPEPCGSVELGTLKQLLPGVEPPQDGASADSGTAGKAPESSASASPYEGEAMVTYDTDRRVGCRWKSTNSLATRHLSVDFERVVSYDPGVSDDEQAQLLYDERAGQAEIPTDSGPPGDEGSDDGDKSTEKGEDGESGESDQEGDGGDGKGGGGSPGSEKSDSPSSDPEKSDPDASPSPDADLSPRTLDEIGDNAYIDDQLDTGDSGVHRDITLVFRSANVIATVKYDQWLTDKRRTPDSAELQEKARSVAQKLVGEFDDN